MGTKELLEVTGKTPQQEIFEQEGADVVVYSLGWRGDHAADGEEPTALVHSRVFVNGVELPFATGVVVRATGGDFVEASIEVVPSSIRFVTLDSEAWKLSDPEGSTDA